MDETRLPENERAAVGGNNPPEDADPILAGLYERHGDLIERRDELLAGAGRAPAEIEDEETAGKMADFVQKQIDAFLKRAKAIHKDEKEPFLSGGRTVDGFLHTLIDDLEAAKKKLNAVRKAYADKKAAEEKARREEEARKAREAAERAQRELEERVAALQDVDYEQWDETALRQAHLQKVGPAPEHIDKAALIQALRIADERALQEAMDAEEAAKEAAAAEERAAREAAAKPSEMGRSRGDHGGMTTLKEYWTFSDLDRQEIDLEALRDHLSTDALEKAVRSWIGANKDALKDGKRLAGVRIYKDTRL